MICAHYLYKKFTLFIVEKKRRHHFEWNEIKKSIIEFILNTEGTVIEPDVSGFLKSRFGEFSRSTINKHLNALGKLGCIELVKSENKSKFNRWDIKTPQNLEKIVEEYPDLLENLQDNEIALKIVLDGLEDALVSSTNLKKTKEYTEKYDEIKERLSEIRGDLKTKLKMSSFFFKLCIQDEYSLWRNLSDLMEITDGDPVAEAFIGNDFKLFINSPACIDVAFKACIAIDIMKRKGNIRKDMQEEIEYIKKLNNTVSKKQLEQLEKYYETVQKAPYFIRDVKFISVYNSELYKLQMDFEDRGGNWDYLNDKEQEGSA